MTRFDKTLAGFVSIFFSFPLWPSLPNISLIACASLVLILAYYFRVSAKIVGVLLGFIWFSSVGHYHISTMAENRYFSQNILIQGDVLNLQKFNATNIAHRKPVKLNLRLSKLGNNSFSYYPLFLRPKVRLSWYESSLSLSQGDSVQLLAKLKPAAGLANEGGFNYQKWLVSQGINATGYVKKSPSNALLSNRPTHRQFLVNQLESLNIEHGRFIHALSYGDRRFLTDQDWKLLQDTGTAHLFAISGMHLATVFAGCLLFVTLTLKGVNFFCAWVNAPFMITKSFKKCLLLVSLLACLLYSNFAGYQIPVIRAWLTLCLLVLLALFGKNWSKTNIILTMLSIIGMVFPLSILSLSFWFSMTAVCLIIFFVWRYPLTRKALLKDKICYALKLQSFLSLLTLPLILIFFKTLPFSALLSNALMIPITTFLLLPLCLLGTVFSVFSIPVTNLYWVLDVAFEYTLSLLRLVHHTTEFYIERMFDEFFPNTTSNSFTSHLIDWVSTPFFYFFVLVILLPPIIYKRFIITGAGCVFMLYAYTQSDKPLTEPQTWRFIAFDVGQGSAHIIQSDNRVALYDTGRGNDSFSMAQNVLIPYFNHYNITSLEYVLISHYDNDHSGGIGDIKQAMDVTEVYDPANFCNRSSFVSMREKDNGFMQLNELNIEILWPLEPSSLKHNNNSCVVKVSSEHHSVLMTGDIEQKAEKALMAHYKGTFALKADVMLAPHHGSKSSSSAAFIDEVNPLYVIFSAGYRNRWGFPNEEVLKRYNERGIKTFHTGDNGQLIFTFTSGNVPSIQVKTYRQDIDPKWYNTLNSAL